MKNKFILLSILLLLFPLTGCIGINEEFSKIRDSVIKSFGEEYHSEVQFSLGSVGMTLSSWIVDVSEEENLSSDILDDVSSIQVGVYEKIKGSNEKNISALYDIESEMQKSGWKSIIKSSSNNELAAVYIRNDNEDILNRLFIINYDGSELVLVEVEGDLQEAIAAVIKEKGIKINI
ncbi:MAG: DUF4252 domain-containing protein [bacterium]|nr:DUF4252 domain-containing protein [bacterium]